MLAIFMSSFVADQLVIFQSSVEGRGGVRWEGKEDERRVWEGKKGDGMGRGEKGRKGEL